MPWTMTGSTEADMPLASWLQVVVPEALIGSLYYGATLGVLAVVLLVVAIYLVLPVSYTHLTLPTICSV